MLLIFTIPSALTTRPSCIRHIQQTPGNLPNACIGDLSERDSMTSVCMDAHRSNGFPRPPVTHPSSWGPRTCSPPAEAARKGWFSLYTGCCFRADRRRTRAHATKRCVTSVLSSLVALWRIYMAAARGAKTLKTWTDFGRFGVDRVLGPAQISRGQSAKSKHRYYLHFVMFPVSERSGNVKGFCYRMLHCPGFPE